MHTRVLSKSIRIVLLAVVFFSATHQALAANPVERGGNTTLVWSITGASQCTASAIGVDGNNGAIGAYPISGDGINRYWYTTHTGLISGNEYRVPFTGVTGDSSRPFPQTYTFTCTYIIPTGGTSVGSATLTVTNCTGGKTWDGATCQDTGLSITAAPPTQDITLPTTAFTINATITNGGGGTKCRIVDWLNNPFEDAPFRPCTHTTESFTYNTPGVISPPIYRYHIEAQKGTDIKFSNEVSVNVLDSSPSDCSVPATLGGGTLAVGGSIDAYENDSVTFPAVCKRQTRTCIDVPPPALSGSYTYPSCTQGYSTPSVSCKSDIKDPFIGQQVTWTASPSGGSGSYSYSWSGDENLSGAAVSVDKTYWTAGTKNAYVIVTDRVSLKQSDRTACDKGVNQPGGGSTSCPGPGCPGGGGTDPGTCTASLDADPNPVEEGQNTALSWSVSGGSVCASSCSGVVNGIKGFETNNQISGTDTVLPTPDKNSYTLTCQCTGPTCKYGPPSPVNRSVGILQPAAILTANGQSKTARVNPNTLDNTKLVWAFANVASCSIKRNSTSNWMTGTTTPAFSAPIPKSITTSPVYSAVDTVTTQTIYKILCANRFSTQASSTVIVNVLTDFTEF